VLWLTTGLQHELARHFLPFFLLPLARAAPNIRPADNRPVGNFILGTARVEWSIGKMSWCVRLWLGVEG
jgi:hypothetical protein